MESEGENTVEEPESGLDWKDCRPVELTPILQHASEAFYEHGFHGTSVRDLAGRVGVTVPALYYHHANKEAILVAVLEASIADLELRGTAAVADGGDDPIAQAANLVESMVLHLTVRARLAALDSEYRYLDAEVRRPYADSRKRNELLTRSVIERGVEAGVFRVADIDEATRALLGLLQAIPRWYDPARALTPAEMARRYVGLSLALLGVPPGKEPPSHD